MGEMLTYIQTHQGSKLNEPTNQNSRKVLKVVKPTNKKNIIKPWGLVYKTANCLSLTVNTYFSIRTMCVGWGDGG